MLDILFSKLKRKPHITKSQEGTSHDKILSYGTVIVNFQEMVMKTKGSVGWACVAHQAPSEGSVLSFLKAEWKVSDTGSAHWAFSFHHHFLKVDYHCTIGQNFVMW
jgi:hypothetical protein